MANKEQCNSVLEGQDSLLLKMSLCLSVYEEIYLFYKSEMLLRVMKLQKVIILAIFYYMLGIKPRIKPNVAFFQKV